MIREHALEDLNRYGVRKPPPSWAPGAPLGQTFQSATVTANGRRLTVAFTGAKGPATVRCGADYSAEAVEGVSAVIVILTSHPHRAGETCTQVGYPRTAALTLAHPLGKRAVLEVVRGLPVPVKKAD